MGGGRFTLVIAVNLGAQAIDIDSENPASHCVFGGEKGLL